MPLVVPASDFDRKVRGESPTTVERFASAPSTPPSTYSSDHHSDHDAAPVRKLKVPTSSTKRSAPGLNLENFDIDFILGNDPAVFRPPKRTAVAHPLHDLTSLPSSAIVMTQRRQRPAGPAAVDFTVAAFLSLPSAMWNELLPLGVAVDPSTVAHAASVLGLAAPTSSMRPSAGF
jgi:hypothetical protein